MFVIWLYEVLKVINNTGMYNFFLDNTRYMIKIFYVAK